MCSGLDCELARAVLEAVHSEFVQHGEQEICEWSFIGALQVEVAFQSAVGVAGQKKTRAAFVVVERFRHPSGCRKGPSNGPAGCRRRRVFFNLSRK